MINRCIFQVSILFTVQSTLLLAETRNCEQLLSFEQASRFDRAHENLSAYLRQLLSENALSTSELERFIENLKTGIKISPIENPEEGAARLVADETILNLLSRIDDTQTLLSDVQSILTKSIDTNRDQVETADDAQTQFYIATLLDTSDPDQLVRTITYEISKLTNYPILVERAADLYIKLYKERYWGNPSFGIFYSQIFSNPECNIHRDLFLKILRKRKYERNNSNGGVEYDSLRKAIIEGEWYLDEELVDLYLEAAKHLVGNDYLIFFHASYLVIKAIYPHHPERISDAAIRLLLRRALKGHDESLVKQLFQENGPLHHRQDLYESAIQNMSTPRP